MLMKDIFCDTLDLAIQFPKDQFDKSAFLADLRDVPDELKEREYFSWAYGSLENPGKQHAHISVDLRGKKTALVNIVYHGEDPGIKDLQPPYMEDCAQWIGSFIKGDVEPYINAYFDYPSTFHPGVVL